MYVHKIGNRTFVKKLVIIFSICCCLVFIAFEDAANAVLPAVKENIEKELSQKQKPKEEMSERELVENGNFPFLPDNHRDSGTGKFNSI